MRTQITNVDEIKSITSLSKDERETTISFYEDEKTLSLVTSSNRMLTKLKKCMKENSNEYRCYLISEDENKEPTGYEFIFPTKYLKFTKKAREGRVFTEEEKKQAAERLKRAREKNNEN